MSADEIAAAESAVGDSPDDDPYSGLVTPEQVHNVAFSKPPIGLRGYNEDEVDAFLDRVEATIVELRRRLSEYEAGSEAP